MCFSLTFGFRCVFTQHGKPPRDDELRKLIETGAHEGSHADLATGIYDEADDAAFIKGLLANAESEARDLQAALATASAAMQLPALASLGAALRNILVECTSPLQVRHARLPF